MKGAVHQINQALGLPVIWLWRLEGLSVFFGILLSLSLEQLGFSACALCWLARALWVMYLGLWSLAFAHRGHQGAWSLWTLRVMRGVLLLLALFHLATWAGAWDFCLSPQMLEFHFGAWAASLAQMRACADEPTFLMLPLPVWMMGAYVFWGLLDRLRSNQ